MAHGAARRAVAGTVWSFLAEGLAIPTGLLTAAFLTRRLGPELYGLYMLAAALIAWVEWSVTSVFTRATVKLVSEADDWRPLGSAIVRQCLLVSLPVTLLLVVLAGPIAQALGAPALGAYLRLFALEIPLFTLARVHRGILTGLEGFGRQALIGAGRWIARLALIVLLVQLGFSVTGAILGSVAATVVELAISRAFIRPSLTTRAGVGAFPARRLWGYAGPLFLSATSQRVFDRADLIALKALGGTAAAAGVYGAAQTVALFPGMLALSMNPVLLAAMGRLARAGDRDGARALAAGALRASTLLLPFAAMIAGAAGEIARLLFGSAFVAAGPLMALLVVAAIGTLILSVGTSLLIAADRIGGTMKLTGFLLPLAFTGYVLVIPRFGAIGAAAVTTAVAWVMALAALVVVHRVWGVRPATATLVRTVAASILAYALAAAWPSDGLAVLLEMAVIAAVVVCTLVALGELGPADVALARSLLRGPGRDQEPDGGRLAVGIPTPSSAELRSER